MTPSRPDVLRFLAGLSPGAAEKCVWGGGMELEISAYLTDQSPPADLVSSVRSLLFRDGAVMVMTSKDGTQHVLPGGRCEPGESFDETLRRELGEETGWQADMHRQIGLLRLSHLSPRPPGFRYPYPDSFQIVYSSEATEELPDSDEVEDEWEEEARFVPMSEVFAIDLAPTDRALLEAALSRR